MKLFLFSVFCLFLHLSFGQTQDLSKGTQPDAEVEDLFPPVPDQNAESLSDASLSSTSASLKSHPVGGLFFGCRLTEIRSIDGSNNNLKPGQKDFGATGTNRIRLAPQEVPGEGIATDVDPTLPGPRVISNELHDQPSSVPQNDDGTTSWGWAWGQFIDHDVAGEPDLDPDVNPDEMLICHDPICPLPITIPANDPHFGQFLPPGQTGTMDFHRSPYKLGPSQFPYGSSTVKTRERLYPNVISHWVDGSNLYGSTPEQLKALTDFNPWRCGFLLTYKDQGLFPPINPANLDENLVGDVRGNENLSLISIHTLWVREHNRIAKFIWAVNGWPRCSDKIRKEIFECARAYVIGLMQKITYDEWLPQFLGPQLFKDVIGDYKGYDDKINPNVSTEYTVGAFRVGHTLINELLLRINPRSNKEETPIELKDAFFVPAPKYMADKDLIREIVLGLGFQKGEEGDRHVVSAVRNMLFDSGLHALDLTALNAQRGRDNGNDRFSTVWKSFCRYFLKWSSTRCASYPYSKFSDFTKNKKVADILRKLYGKPERVELFAGGLAEDAPKGYHLPRFFGLIVAEQFKRLRDGDRFWYERYLSPGLVSLIKRDSLWRVIRRNLNVRPCQKNFNVFVSC